MLRPLCQPLGRADRVRRVCVRATQRAVHNRIKCHVAQRRTTRWLNQPCAVTLCSVAGHSSPRNPTTPPPRVPPNRALLSFFKDFSSTRGKGKGKPGTRLKSDRRFCVLLISSWLGERGGERACCCTFSSNEGVIK